jgi:hypothetical protein
VRSNLKARRAGAAAPCVSEEGPPPVSEEINNQFQSEYGSEGGVEVVQEQANLVLGPVRVLKTSFPQLRVGGCREEILYK